MLRNMQIRRRFSTVLASGKQDLRVATSASRENPGVSMDESGVDESGRGGLACISGRVNKRDTRTSDARG